jgi:hypothetical protein
MVTSFVEDRIADTIPLTSKERALKERLEAIVERGIQKFLEVGLALGELRARRLYRTTHPTFAEYVKDRFGLARSTVDGVIRSAQTAQSLLDSGLDLPANVGEAMIRPISALPGDDDLKAATWEFVQTIAPECGPTQPLVSRCILSWFSDAPLLLFLAYPRVFSSDSKVIMVLLMTGRGFALEAKSRLGNN